MSSRSFQRNLGFSDLLTGEESQLYADSVYDSKEGRAGLARRAVALAILQYNACHAGLAAIVHNLKKGLRFYRLYGLPNPAFAG